MPGTYPHRLKETNICGRRTGAIRNRTHRRGKLGPMRLDINKPRSMMSSMNCLMSSRMSCWIFPSLMAGRDHSRWAAVYSSTEAICGSRIPFADAQARPSDASGRWSVRPSEAADVTLRAALLFDRFSQATAASMACSSLSGRVGGRFTELHHYGERPKWSPAANKES